ncbi:MAG: hypothetical protein RIS88_2928 [Pseudomonadota bacterium]
MRPTAPAYPVTDDISALAFAAAPSVSDIEFQTATLWL